MMLVIADTSHGFLGRPIGCCLNNQGEAGKVVIMAVPGVDKEVERLVGPKDLLRLLKLKHELLVVV